jgi:hypothetical protein
MCDYLYRHDQEVQQNLNLKLQYSAQNSWFCLASLKFLVFLVRTSSLKLALFRKLHHYGFVHITYNTLITMHLISLQS